MRLEWLEDILAVLETGSLIRAAEKRFLSQPAFSRRIKLIEKHVGVELFDHSKKPVQLHKFVSEQQQNMQILAAGLRDLGNELKRQAFITENRIVIACQHAITTSVVPTLVSRLSSTSEFNTRLRSANHDECFSLLITKQADFILIHQCQNEKLLTQDGVFEQYQLEQERFIPVFPSNDMAHFKEEYAKNEISVITYPADSYLGKVVNREFFSQLWTKVTIHKKAETALTLAALPLALAGVGIAWLPQSVAASDLASGKLTDLSDLLPSCLLSIVAVRLNNSTSNNAAWNIIISH